MAAHNSPPMVNYTVKMMLLEAVRCYKDGDYHGLKWVELQMFVFSTRLKELEKRDGKF
jgi:hypothetical protein